MAGREENDLTFYLRGKELVFPAFAYIPNHNLRFEWKKVLLDTPKLQGFGLVFFIANTAELV